MKAKIYNGGQRPKLKISTSNGHINCSLLSYNDPVENEAGFLEEFQVSIDELLQPISDTFINSFTIPEKSY